MPACLTRTDGRPTHEAPMNVCDVSRGNFSLFKYAYMLDGRTDGRARDLPIFSLKEMSAHSRARSQHFALESRAALFLRPFCPNRLAHSLSLSAGKQNPRTSCLCFGLVSTLPISCLGAALRPRKLRFHPVTETFKKFMHNALRRRIAEVLPTL